MEQYYNPQIINGKKASLGEVSKKDALNLLNTDENRMKLIVATMLLILLWISVGSITAALWIPIAPLLEKFTVLYDNLYDISVLIDYILIFLFVLPVSFGMYTLAHRMCAGEKAETADVFHAYRNLPRTWLVMLISALPILIIAGTIWGFGAIHNYLNTLTLITNSDSNLAIIIYLCMIAVAVILLFGTIILAVRGFFFVGLAMRGDISVRQALSMSFVITRGRMREIIAYFFSFTGWAALSFCTIGVMAVIHLIPYYKTSYMIYCGRALNKGDI